MLRVFLLVSSATAFACAAALIHFTHGHEVAAFILVLTSAVLLVGASIVHAVHSLREDVAGLRRHAGGAYPP